VISTQPAVSSRMLPKTGWPSNAVEYAVPTVPVAGRCAVIVTRTGPDRKVSRALGSNLPPDAWHSGEWRRTATPSRFLFDVLTCTWSSSWIVSGWSAQRSCHSSTGPPHARTYPLVTSPVGSR